MRLTRRDALAALAAVGVGGTAGGALSGGVVPPRGDAGRHGPAATSDPEVEIDADVLDSLTAAAEVLYPSAVDGHDEFVQTYVVGRLADRPAYRRGLVRAVSDLEATALDWFGASLAELAVGTRGRLLRELGVETADPDPEGTVSDRIRFYVVNDLLFALYTSPTGGRLVGIENPVGYPGGTESYRRGPDAAEGGGDDG